MLRDLRDALRRMMDAANRLKAAETDVGMLMAYAGVLDDLQGKFEHVGRRLTQIERTVAPATSGGGSVPVPGAPPDGGGGGGAPVDIGPRMARSAVSAGADRAPSAARDITPTGNPLFFAPQRKDLQGFDNPSDTQFASAGERA